MRKEACIAEHARAAMMVVEPGRIGIRSFPRPDPEPGAALIKSEPSGIRGADRLSYLGYAVQHSGTERSRTLPSPIVPGRKNVGGDRRARPGAGSRARQDHAVPRTGPEGLRFGDTGIMQGVGLPGIRRVAKAPKLGARHAIAVDG